MAGNDANTKLLLHFDRAPLADDAVGGTTKTLVNGGTLCNTVSRVKFGYGSLLCYGVNGNLTVQPSADFRLAGGDFMIEGWFWVGEEPYLFCWYGDANNYFALQHLASIGATCRLRLRWRIAGETIISIDDPGYATLKNGFHHVAVIREGIELAIYVDGAPYAAGELPSAIYPVNLQNWPLYVGRGLTSSGALGHFGGWIDEFRVHRAIPDALVGGVGTESFTPATEAYAERCHQIARGIYPVRRPCQQVARGIYSLALYSCHQIARGVHVVRSAGHQIARGVHPVRAARHQIARGVYVVGGTISPPLKFCHQVCRGVYALRAARHQVARGVYNMAMTSAHQIARGVYRVDCSCHQVARGVYSIKREAHQIARGVYAIEEAEDAYELYYAQDGEPDLEGDPWETFASLPHETAAISGAGVHNFVLRARNKWGLRSQNLDAWSVELDAEGAEVPPRPSAPGGIAVTPAANGAVRVTASYLYHPDGANAADQWYLSVTDPPDTDYETIDMVKVGGIARLDWTSASYGDANELSVLVQTKQSTGRTSANDTPVDCTTSTAGPPAPSPKAYQHRRGMTVRVG